MWRAYPTCHTAQPKHTTETATNSGACARTRLISRSRSRRRMQQKREKEWGKKEEEEDRDGEEGEVVGEVVGEGVEEGVEEGVAVQVGTASWKWVFFILKIFWGWLGKGGEGLGHSLMGAPLLYLLNFALNFGALQQAAAINLEAQQALRASKWSVTSIFCFASLPALCQSVSQSSSLSPSLTMSVVVTVPSPCATLEWSEGRGQRFAFLWMWMRLWIALDVRAWQSLRLFFLSPAFFPSLPLAHSLLFCFLVASFKHDNKDYSWSLLLLLLLLLLLAKH